MVVGHAVKEEGGVSGAGRFHLVPYGVPKVGPCRSDGVGGYGGGPASVCCPCLGHGACGRLEGGGGVCQVGCLEAYGGVQDPGEVVRQALVGQGEGLGGRGPISGEMGEVSLQLWREGGVLRVGGLDYPQVGGGCHDLHGGPLWPQGGVCGRPLDHGH